MLRSTGIRLSVVALVAAALACAVPAASSAGSGSQRSTDQARLLIPALGVHAIIGSDLMKGPVFWPSVAGRPGGGDIIAIAGHDVTPVPGFGWHGPFRYAYTLKPGTRITVVWHRKRYNYAVTGHRVFPDWYLYPFPPRDHEWLVLSTCFPPGSAATRMYIYARPIPPFPKGTA